MIRLLASLLLICSAFAQQAANIPQPVKPDNKPIQAAAGLEYYDLKVGTGKKAIPGFTLRVLYTGWYKKGKNSYALFDTTDGRGPFQFDLGMRQVIKGWDSGIAGMRVGGKRQLIISPELGYGSQGSNNIPGNATLIFEVELVEVR